MTKLIDFEGKRGKGEVSFVKVPRWVFDWVYSNDYFERQCGRVYLGLIVNSHFNSGEVVLNRSTYTCERGEMVGSVRDLAKNLDMQKSSVYRALEALKESCLIDMKKVKGGTRFKVIGYDEIVKGKKQISAETVMRELTPAEALYEYDRKFGGRNLEFDLPEEN